MLWRHRHFLPTTTRYPYPGDLWLSKTSEELKLRGVTCHFCLPEEFLGIALAAAPTLWPFPGWPFTLYAGGGELRTLAVVLSILKGAVQTSLQFHPVLGFFKKDRSPPAHSTKRGAGRSARGLKGQSVQAAVAEQALEGVALPLQRLLIKELALRLQPFM